MKGKEKWVKSEGESHQMSSEKKVEGGNESKVISKESEEKSFSFGHEKQNNAVSQTSHPKK